MGCIVLEIRVICGVFLASIMFMVENRVSSFISKADCSQCFKCKNWNISRYNCDVYILKRILNSPDIPC